MISVLDSILLNAKSQRCEKTAGGISFAAELDHQNGGKIVEAVSGEQSSK